MKMKNEYSEWRNYNTEQTEQIHNNTTRVPLLLSYISTQQTAGTVHDSNMSSWLSYRICHVMYPVEQPRDRVNVKYTYMTCT